MKKKILLVLLAICIVSCLFIFHQHRSSEKFKNDLINGNIASEDILSIKVDIYGIHEIILTKDNDMEDINEFVDAYNKCKRLYGNNHTPAYIRAFVQLKNKRYFSIYGELDGSQFIDFKGKGTETINIVSEDLEEYFRKIEKETVGENRYSGN